MDGPREQLVRQGGQGGLFPFLVQQVGEASGPGAVERHEAIAGILRQAGMERLQFRHGNGLQFRMPLQQVQHVAFILLRGVGTGGVQQEPAGSQALQGGQQDAPLALGIPSGGGCVETSGSGNALGEQGLSAARGVRKDEVKTARSLFRSLVRAQPLRVQVQESAAQ